MLKYRFSKYLLNLLVSLGLLASLGLFMSGCSLSKKPLLPPLKSGLTKPLTPKDSTEPKFSQASPVSEDINAQADFYALAVANGNWDMANKMSTTTNKLILKQRIQPRLTGYWRQWGVKQPLNPVVSFETSRLVTENFDDQIVMESLQYASKTGQTRMIYLQFHISKVGNSYLVNDTLLLTKTKVFPGA